MSPLTLALLTLLAPALHAEPKLSGTGVAVARSVSAAGGGIATGGGLTLDSVVAEAVVFTATGGGFSTDPGLMSLIAQPGTVASIAAVSKDTGTMTLSWVSPGLDGFVGDVASGFYRIDSSSDPLHVFDPTLFTAELATTVAPGATQFYTLTGLEPNTTYYSRVYLADSRKVVSETSAPSEESSLARVPDAPVISGVYGSSVTISWLIPAGGAAGFRLDASSINFLGYGAVVSSETPNGTAVTLTIGGLTPDTVYFFNLGSLNWQSDVDFHSVLSTRTHLGGPEPILGLALAGNARERTMTLTWTNPVFENPAGVTILVSSSPISTMLADGTPYPLGTTFADGSVVKSSAIATSYLEAALSLDTTAYFSLFSRDGSNAYSVAVSTSLVLDLPPMAPAGLYGTLSDDSTSFMLNWADISSNLDGSGFISPTAPSAWELHHYDVYRATGIVRANWVHIGSAPVTAVTYDAGVPTTGDVYYYKVVSRDAFQGDLEDSAMTIDTIGNLWAVHPDMVSRMQIPASIAKIVRASGNPTGSPLLVRAEDRPEDLAGRIIQSTRFDPIQSPGNLPAQLPTSAIAYNVTQHYDTVGGMIVPSAGGAPIRNSPENLSSYYIGEGKAVQVFGLVDPYSQEVSVHSGILGTYQVRTVVRSAEFNLDSAGISNRALTPNGDGLNDTVVFHGDNPKDSAFSGKIFDIRGRVVAEMTPTALGGPTSWSLMWNGKAGGVAVPRGVYIYQITAEKQNFSGTLVVIR